MPALTPAIRERIIALKREGHANGWIAREYGCNESTVRRVLKKAAGQSVERRVPKPMPDAHAEPTAPTDPETPCGGSDGRKCVDCHKLLIRREGEALKYYLQRERCGKGTPCYRHRQLDRRIEAEVRRAAMATEPPPVSRWPDWPKWARFDGVHALSEIEEARFRMNPPLMHWSTGSHWSDHH
jgi:hypothetical protein